VSGDRRLFVSFSGGATSAFMAWACLHITFIRSRYDDVRVVFANTGLEHPRTLDFVSECDRAFGLGLVRVEANVFHGERRSSGFRVVGANEVSRDGEPFESVIQKYGIPNKAFPHCTRELKVNPLHAYMRSIGWAKGTYDTAIGIRIDEIDRMAADAASRRIIYPLVSWLPMTKADIAKWWDTQSFRLGLEEHEGNCVTCWKKSERKLLRLRDERPESFDFMRRMERDYGSVGPEFAKANPPTGPRVFFRGGRSTDELFQIGRAALEPGEPTRCDESCEVFS
jgi:hypothetical protein